jgi:hypothetical protein
MRADIKAFTINAASRKKTFPKHGYTDKEKKVYEQAILEFRVNGQN